MNELNHQFDKTIKGEIESMVYQGKKILAIKVYRRAAFMGLNGMTVWLFFRNIYGSGSSLISKRLISHISSSRFSFR